jgi:biopolymer transport protein TolQ
MTTTSSKVVPSSQSALDLALGTGPIVQLVLIVLILCSVFSWAIIFAKMKSLARARKESLGFLDLFWNSKSLETIFNETRHFSSSPVSNVFRAGYMEFQKLTSKATEKSVPHEEMAHSGIDNVQRALRKTAMLELLKLERL